MEAGHHGGEHVEPKKRDRVDRTCGESQSDKKEVATTKLAHLSAGRELADDVGKRREIVEHTRR